MKPATILWLVSGGVLLVWLYSQRQAVAADVTSAVDSGVDDVTAAIAGWQQVQAGPLWVPVLHAAEQQYGIPTDLLARIAYQESHFRPDIIDGTVASSAGALGLMQLLGGTNSAGVPWFTSVAVPRPFTPADTTAQIQQAAQLLVSLMNHYNDWALAVAAYNDGRGNIDAYVAGNRALPSETANYVADILADVPLNGSSLPA